MTPRRYPHIYVTGYNRAILYHTQRRRHLTDVIPPARAVVADRGGCSQPPPVRLRPRRLSRPRRPIYSDWSPQKYALVRRKTPGYRSYFNPGNYRGKMKALSTTIATAPSRAQRILPGHCKPKQSAGARTSRVQQRRLTRIAVANDTWPTFLFSHHDGTFPRTSPVSSSGIAASEAAASDAGMESIPPTHVVRLRFSDSLHHASRISN